MRTSYKTIFLVTILFASFISCKEVDPVITNQSLTEASKEILRLSSGKIYYIDNLNGRNEHQGTSPATTWKTISKVNAILFQPGDKILFRAGGSWTKQLHPQGSGISGSPIVKGRYGSGNKPRINGAGISNGTIYLYNQQYWEINDLEINNFDTSQPNAQSIQAWEANNSFSYANAMLPKQVINRAIPKIGVLIAVQDVGKSKLHLFAQP